ncbi:MAG: glycosyltransferase family 4 protein [Bacteroidales bacterium]|nr:glycosyltransferase family 4 protein [Bacteroidales bacterium]
MKVLMIAPYPVPGTPIRGGVETVTYNLIEGFKACPDVHVLVLVMCHDKDAELKVADNITVRYLHQEGGSRKGELAGHGRKVMESIIDEWHPDIIHIQGNGSNFLLTDRKRRDITVLTQHGIIWNEMKQSKNPRVKANMFIAHMIERLKRGNVGNWVFISRYNQDLNSRKFLNKLTYRQLYNPVNPAYFTTASASRSKEGFKLLFVGRIVPRKGLKALLVGMGQSGLKDRIELNIVGGYEDPAYENEIKGAVAAYGLENNVIFHGWRTSQEIIEMYKDIDALVLPSYQETLPCVIAEAMALGKPVIATKVGGIPEMVDDGETGFLYDADNTTELVEVLQRFGSLSDEEMERMRRKAVEKARDLYEPASVARKHVEFYKEILKS